MLISVCQSKILWSVTTIIQDSILRYHFTNRFSFELIVAVAVRFLSILVYFVFISVYF